MTYQTDKGLPVAIQKYGCYFMSLLYHLNKTFGKPAFFVPDVIEVYNHETKDGDLGDEAYMLNPQGVCDSIVPGKVRFKGHAPSDYKCFPHEFEIQCWYNPRTEFHHFVAGADGRVVYDPIAGGSVTVREGKLESKRIFAVR